MVNNINIPVLSALFLTILPVVMIHFIGMFYLSCISPLVLYNLRLEWRILAKENVMRSCLFCLVIISCHDQSPCNQQTCTTAPLYFDWLKWMQQFFILAVISKSSQ